MHQRSFTSEDFQSSYRQESRDYCVSCHAPLEDRTAGIGCTACHTAHRAHTVQAANRPHATTKECRTCHDFDVPGTPTMLQGTEREHRVSAFADRSCESCHMKRGHGFDVTRNRELLARAVRVEDAELDAGELVVRVASQGVGHRFPTGDLFRRLVVVVTAFDDHDALRCAGTFYLRRDVTDHRRHLAEKRPESDDHDTRLGDAPRALRVACATKPSRVHVTVSYERGAAGTGDDLDLFASLDLLDRDVTLR